MAPDGLDLAVSLGPVQLRSPLVAAAGTVGSVVELAGVADLGWYGAAVAKSVSAEPWPGREPPRLAPAGAGMLNGIGIQNPGITRWVDEIAPRLSALDVPVWGSAVGSTPAEFAHVAESLEAAGVAAVELNLSCPNLDHGGMFALDPKAAADVVRSVRDAVTCPVGAKLSPNSEIIVSVADAVMAAGADWLVLTNTVWGMGIDVASRRPKLSGGIGGLSGPPLKPIALRCVWEVCRALPGVPIVGCGGVTSGVDIVEYLLAGASAVAIGTAHLADPKAGARIGSELVEYCRTHRIAAVRELVAAADPW